MTTPMGIISRSLAFHKRHGWLLYTFVLLLGQAMAQPMYTGPLDGEALAKYVATNNIASVEQLMQRLPESLRSQFTLVYDTRNTAQFASKELPRVILFSNDGRFYMSVAGSRDVKGGNTVEMISQRANGRYSFSNIVFEEGRSTFTADPPICASCHGRTPRPIWDGYPRWPGSYGSDHSAIKTRKPDLKTEREYIRQSVEYKALDDFHSADTLSHGRYSSLARLPATDTRGMYQIFADMNMHMSEVLVD